MPHPLGAENLRTLDDMADAVVGMRPQRPAMDSVIVKLNEGVSGSGNAVVDPDRAAEPGLARRAGRGDERLRQMELESDTMPFERLRRQVRRGRRDRRGADHRARAPEPERPAAGPARWRGRAALDPRPAARWAPAGRATSAACSLRLRSTPGSSPSTRSRSGSGWPGRAPSAGSRSTSSWSASAAATWTPYAIELNLRKGGTTHPFLTLQFLTDGRYDPDDRPLHSRHAATRSTSWPPTTSSPRRCAG